MKTSSWLILGLCTNALLVSHAAFSGSVGKPMPIMGGKGDSNCNISRLTFSADSLLNVPSASNDMVWGGNATGGDHLIAPPYSNDFISMAETAHQGGLGVFAYLEGPCGDTGGKDDGERNRCKTLHNDYNREYSKKTPDNDFERWKPFTIKQMKLSKKYHIDFCEIDNLNNNVTIPLIPLLAEIKELYDSGAIHCQLVLKNLEESDLNEIKAEIAPRPYDAGFIAPFHIFEADDISQKRTLDAAMIRLKGVGSTTIISTNTDAYGSAFTDDEFLSCLK